jgi:hypothetical protein
MLVSCVTYTSTLKIKAMYSSETSSSLRKVRKTCPKTNLINMVYTEHRKDLMNAQIFYKETITT